MKWAPSISIILLFACSNKQNGNAIKVIRQKDTTLKPDTAIVVDSIWTTEHYYTDLSYSNNYKLVFNRDYRNGEISKDYWTVIIYDKKTNKKIDSFSQPMISDGSDFQDFKNARSLVTGTNKSKDAVDNDYGDMVVADLNFDLMDDIALVNDLGGNGGRFYSYYIQRNNKFVLNQFLTDSMVYFPSKIISKKRQLITYVHAGVCGLGEHKYGIDKKTNDWKEVSHRIIDICKD